MNRGKYGWKGKKRQMTGFIIITSKRTTTKFFGIKDGTVQLRNHSLALQALVKRYSVLQAEI